MTLTKAKVNDQWSGGGENLLSNAALADEKYAQSGKLDQPPVILKNVVPLKLLVSGNFVYIPQNAWAWHGPVENVKEFTRRSLLRVVSSVAMYRAKRNVRIGPMIPENSNSWPRYLPNTLDESFEQVLEESNSFSGLPWLPEEPYFLVPGSFWSYRNHSMIINAYAQYSAVSEKPLALVIVGPATQIGYVEKLKSQCTGINGVHIVERKVPRAEILYAMKTAALCLFPSFVEASPVSVLEAAVVGASCAAFDITAHQYMCQYHKINHFIYFKTTGELETILLSHRVKSACPLDSLEARAKAREDWIDEFQSSRTFK